MSENLILGQFTVGTPQPAAQQETAATPATQQASTENTPAPVPATSAGGDGPTQSAGETGGASLTGKPDTDAPASAPTPELPPSIFKEFGIDEAYGRSLLQAAADPAKLQEWMHTMAIDPQALTVEQALRMDTQNLYPDFTPEEVEQETALRMRNEFFQNEGADPNDKIRGDKKLQALLGRTQEGLSQKRAAFTAPAPQPTVPHDQATPSPQPDVVALAKDSFFQTFNETRKISFGSGTEPYHYEMEGVDLNKYADDPTQLAGLILNEDGSVNGRKAAILEAMDRNPNLFDDLIKHGGTLRQKEEFEEQHNGKERGLPPAPSKEGHKVFGQYTVGG